MCVGAVSARLHPAKDPQYAGIKWTVYRGVAYDLTEFIPRHPGGSWLANLAVGRDSTALVESYHLRQEMTRSLFQKLPVLKGFPVDLVPRAPYPNDSKLYVDIRERVRDEVFGGKENKGYHRRGSEHAAVAVLSFAVAAYCIFAYAPSFWTGMLLGVAGAWIGVTIQHCGNHGAMSTSPAINLALGSCDDLIGGSSLMWRYHHQVSHHIHTNDQELDEDVCSMYPLLRFDPRLPRRAYHAWQHLYIWVAYPFLHVAFQLGDLQSLAVGRTVGAELSGAATWEKLGVLLGKAAHYTLLLLVPGLSTGWGTALLGAAGYSTSLSILLALMFFVSHNVPGSKPLAEGRDTQAVLYTDMEGRDWGEQQILASASWGSTLGNFFTGGLNLQIEHHLFPAISFAHYPAIQEVVKEECVKRNIRYNSYSSLLSILGPFLRCMKELGSAPDVPPAAAAAAVAAKAR